MVGGLPALSSLGEQRFHFQQELPQGRGRDTGNQAGCKGSTGKGDCACETALAPRGPEAALAVATPRGETGTRQHELRVRLLHTI